MSELANLEVILEASRRAVIEANLPTLERLSQLVWRAILNAAMANDRPELEKIRDRLVTFHAASRPKLKDKDTAAQMENLLRYDAALAEVAAMARPTGVPAKKDADLRKASDRVVSALRARPMGVSTSALAALTGLSRETVSRTLSELKAQGLVRARKAGRHMISRLTPRGTRAGLTSSAAHPHSHLISRIPVEIASPPPVRNTGISIAALLKEPTAVAEPDPQVLAALAARVQHFKESSSAMVDASNVIPEPLRAVG